MRTFYVQFNVGRSKYVVNFHDGVKTHKDGSQFYDMTIFHNKRKMAQFLRSLVTQGYREIR